MAEAFCRIFPGVIILVLVCILWVFSAEVATYLIKDESNANSGDHNEKNREEHHEKQKVKTGAYFLTYFKSALFSLYLWIVLTVHIIKNGCQNFGNSNDDAMLELSESHYVPLKNADNQYDYDANEDEIYHAAHTEDNSADSSIADSRCDSKTSQKSVRFKNLAEVRHLVKCESSSSTSKTAENGENGNNDSSSTHQLSSISSSLLQFSRRNGFREHAYLAVQCVTLWFFANYFYALALRFTEAAMANILSLTSSIFILFFGLILPSSPSYRLTLTKLVAVSLMISGAVLAGIADSSLEATPLGLVFALLSAFLYSAYLTLIKRRCPNQSTTGVLSLLGFMGLYCLCFFWPPFIVLHALEIEQFEIPTDRNVLILLTTSSLVGSVVADAFWLIGAYMTSSLTATVSLSLTIPMAMLADWLIRSVHIGVLEAVAILPILLGFTLSALTSQWDHWDPVWALVKSCLSPCRSSQARWLMQKTRFLLPSRLKSPSSEDQQACSLLSAVEENDTSAVSS